jgi:hypothetical protein
MLQLTIEAGREGHFVDQIVDSIEWSHARIFLDGLKNVPKESKIERVAIGYQKHRCVVDIP